jgi:Mg-chelatase subunit ChlD
MKPAEEFSTLVHEIAHEMLHSGSEKVIEHRISNALLLLDTSHSMAGIKIQQAKSGAVDFARSASARGYATALAVFADRAAMVCDRPD